MLLEFNSIEELDKYCEKMAPEWNRFLIPYQQGTNLAFHEYSIAIDRACSAAEITKDTLDGWLNAGLKLIPPRKKLPRSTDVSRLCVIREMISLDVPFQEATEIAECLSQSILFHALRSSASLTRVIKHMENRRCKTIQSQLGTDESYLRRFLKGRIATFAVVDQQFKVHLLDELVHHDHDTGFVVDLVGLGMRLAERSDIDLPGGEGPHPHDPMTGQHALSLCCTARHSRSGG